MAVSGWSDIDQAQGELSLARVALAENDLDHAANHVAGAAGYAPSIPELHELLAILAARSEDGALSLFPVGQNMYVGTAVCHAHLLSGRDPGQALAMLAEATAFDPAKPWADAAWVRACSTEGIDPDVLVRMFVTVISALGRPVSESVRQANTVYFELARTAIAAHPQHAVLHGVCSAVARRLGDKRLAVAWGQRGVELEPNKLTMTWYAYALLADGRLDDALAVMHRAWRAYPNECDIAADISSWLADAGRLDEALEVIESAVRTNPSDDCGVHTMHRLRFRRDRDAATHLLALSDFMASQSESSHEHTDLVDCCHGQAWLGQPGWASESVINALRSVPPEKRSGEGNLHVSQMEVPSALATLDRVWPGLRVSFPAPPPELISPLREGPQLWRFDGARLVPAVPAPARETTALLLHTVTPSWPHPVAAYDQALPLGDLPAEQLVAALVHPPSRPDQYGDLPEDCWVRSVQAFACLGLLHCRDLVSRGAAGSVSGSAPRDGTPGQVSDTRGARELLTQLAYGIEDWTTEAALFGLAVAAWAEPACRPEVARTVTDRYRAAAWASQQHVVTIGANLARLVLMVPGVDDDTRAHARGVIDDDDIDESGAT